MQRITIIKRAAKPNSAVASQPCPSAHITADKREIKDFPKLPSATSFIRKPMHERLYLKEREQNDFIELFISILYHDLKNPLFNIMGYNELIGDICPDVEEYQEKIQELIDDVGTYSKVRAVELKFKVVDLTALLADVVLELEYKAKEKGITVKRNYNPELKYEVKASQFLKHVFLNMLDNAIKYGPTRSSVEISVKNQPGERKVCIKDMARVFRTNLSRESLSDS